MSKNFEILDSCTALSKQRYIISGSRKHILMYSYDSDELNITCTLESEGNINKYSTVIESGGNIIECNLFWPPRIEAARNYLKGINNTEPVTLYTESNAKEKSENSYKVSITSPDGKLDYSIDIFNSNNFASYGTYGYEVEPDQAIVKYYVFFNDGFGIIDYDDNYKISHVYRYVIRSNDEPQVIELCNFEQYLTACTKNIRSLSDLPKNIVIDDKRIELAYDSYGLLTGSSDANPVGYNSFKYFDNTYVIHSIHPCYADIYDLSMVGRTDLYALEEVLITNTQIEYEKVILQIPEDKLEEFKALV